MSDMRVVEKRIAENVWVVTTLRELEINDVFRLFEKTGEPVEGLWIIRETPVLQDGVWGVVAEPVEEGE